MRKQSSEKYNRKVAQSRFEATLRGPRIAGHKPMKEVSSKQPAALKTSRALHLNEGWKPNMPKKPSRPPSPITSQKVKHLAGEGLLRPSQLSTKQVQDLAASVMAHVEPRKYKKLTEK